MPKRTTGPLLSFVRDVLPNCKRVGKCLIWQGKLAGGGYGQVKRWINGREKYFKVHRIAYEEVHGPTKLFVLHKCDTPPCVEEKHLFEGTHTANMQDMSRKFRGKPFGRKQQTCKC